VDPKAPDKDPQELVERFKELVARFDEELRKAGLTDEQREQLVKEILEEDSASGSTHTR